MYVAVAEWWVTLVEIAHNHYRMRYVTMRYVTFREPFYVSGSFFDAVFKVLLDRFILFTDLKRYDIRFKGYTCQYCGEKGHPVTNCPEFLAPVIPENDPCESLRRKLGQMLTLAEKRMALRVLFMTLKENRQSI